MLLPHLAGRPLTVKRYPNGVDGAFFFEKNASRGKPDWVRTVRLPAPGSTKNRDEIDYILVEELATLVWLANLAALELHTPQWKVGPRGGVRGADQLVLDLDPGAPATVVECCRVALLLRELLESPTGSRRWRRPAATRALQVYAAVAETPAERTSAYAHELAQPAGGGAAGARRVPDDQVAAAGQGAGRLEPEQRGEDHGERLLAARAAGRDGVHPGHLGRGRRPPRRRRRRSSSPTPTCWSGSPTVTCSRRCWRRPAAEAAGLTPARLRRAPDPCVVRRSCRTAGAVN